MDITTIAQDVYALLHRHLSDLNSEARSLELPLNQSTSLVVHTKPSIPELICQVEFNPHHLPSHASQKVMIRQLLNLSNRYCRVNNIIASMDQKGFFCISAYITENETPRSILKLLELLIDSTKIQNFDIPNKQEKPEGNTQWIAV